MMKTDDDGPIPSRQSVGEISAVIATLKEMITRGDAQPDALNEHFAKLEAHVENAYALNERQKSDIVALLNKHPYFKNPCHYHIRLVTLMKYLKRKGIDTSIKDIDLTVDDIIAGMDGVKRIEYGRYYIENSRG